ncbi:unnamed protein product [Symbiodinium natans]|uniref:Ubiquitin-like domain-containing protein n=1 Tax=Symbiodinium natans TaxID=878477 RepID=A0A812LMP4_9DINO|nr:unnamed protein product [Symbiodinium natans]
MGAAPSGPSQLGAAHSGPSETGAVQPKLAGGTQLPSPPAASADAMDLKVQTISGNVHSVSISTSANLLALHEAVGLALDIKPWELRLTADARVLDLASEGEKTLEALDIKEESEVMVLRCSPCLLETLAGSRSQHFPAFTTFESCAFEHLAFLDRVPSPIPECCYWELSCC